MVTPSSPLGSEPETASNARDQGATIVEYGVTVSVIAFVAMAGVKLFGDRLSDLISHMTSW